MSTQTDFEYDNDNDDHVYESYLVADQDHEFEDEEGDDRDHYSLGSHIDSDYDDEFDSSADLTDHNTEEASNKDDEAPRYLSSDIGTDKTEGEDGNFDNRSITNDAYAFHVVDGRVISVSEVDHDGSVDTELAERNELYTFDGTTVIKTELKLFGQEVTRYALNTDGFYIKESSEWISSAYLINQPYSYYTNKPDTYKFNFVDGAIASITETEDDGSTKFEIPEANETFTYDGTDIIKSQVYASGQELTRFVLNSDGLYVKTSEQWVLNSDNVSSIATPVLIEVLDYEGSELDDNIAVTLTQSAIGGTGADKFVIRDLGHMLIDDFNSGESDLLVFDTGLGLQSVDQLISFVTNVDIVGENLVVEFGSDISITIVGAVNSEIDWGDVIVLS